MLFPLTTSKLIIYERELQSICVLITENEDEECNDEFEDYSDDVIDGVDSVGPSLLEGTYKMPYKERAKRAHSLYITILLHNLKGGRLQDLKIFFLTLVYKKTINLMTVRTLHAARISVILLAKLGITAEDMCSLLEAVVTWIGGNQFTSMGTYNTGIHNLVYV